MKGETAEGKKAGVSETQKSQGAGQSITTQNRKDRLRKRVALRPFTARGGT